ncbi:thioredoxin-like protein 4B [Corticium candelabrum]|uniref:thioredoxin-like protein 4B n=1 Tax=Corticium candelabrum TaxID=121492 RepID=UPI002E2629BD|nr:thioredoxin-like protein 4B [Corticium candelabrum]
MAYLLRRLTTKKEVDNAIKTTEDKVLILRFGRETDSVCRQMDDILEKSQAELENMASIFIVDVDTVPVYTEYFDISLIPATVFFFNAQHMKVDWGTPDHTKFIGSFKIKQNLIDVVETIYRGAMRGKLIVNSPLDSRDVPKYSLLYKDI